MERCVNSAGWLAPKVMKMVEAGQSYRQIAGKLKIDKSTVMAIVRRARN